MSIIQSLAEDHAAILKLNLGNKVGIRRISFAKLWDSDNSTVSYDRLADLAVHYTLFHFQSKPKNANTSTNTNTSSTPSSTSTSSSNSSNSLNADTLKVHITYEDEDGDIVTISSDEELMEAFHQFLTKDPPIRIVRASANMNIKGIRKAIKNEKEEQEHEHEGQDKFQLNISVETETETEAETKIETEAETKTETKPESTPLSIHLSELRLSNEAATPTIAAIRRPTPPKPTVFDLNSKFVKTALVNFKPANVPVVMKPAMKPKHKFKPRSTPSKPEARPQPKPEKPSNPSPPTCEPTPKIPTKPIVSIPPNYRQNFIHGRHTCDGCFLTPIIGYRYNSSNLPDYDLCDKCYENYKGSDVVFEVSQLERDVHLQPRWRQRFHLRLVEIKRSRLAKFKRQRQGRNERVVTTDPFAPVVPPKSASVQTPAPTPVSASVSEPVSASASASTVKSVTCGGNDSERFQAASDELATLLNTENPCPDKMSKAFDTFEQVQKQVFGEQLHLNPPLVDTEGGAAACVNKGENQEEVPVVAEVKDDTEGSVSVVTEVKHDKEEEEKVPVDTATEVKHDKEEEPIDTEVKETETTKEAVDTEVKETETTKEAVDTEVKDETAEEPTLKEVKESDPLEAYVAKMMQNLSKELKEVNEPLDKMKVDAREFKMKVDDVKFSKILGNLTDELKATLFSSIKRVSKGDNKTEDVPPPVPVAASVAEEESETEEAEPEPVPAPEEESKSVKVPSVSNQEEPEVVVEATITVPEVVPSQAPIDTLVLNNEDPQPESQLPSVASRGDIILDGEDDTNVLSSGSSSSSSSSSGSSKGSWEVVEETGREASDAVIARAAQLLGSALFQSDMANTDSNANSSTPFITDSIGSTMTSVPTISSNSDISPTLLFRWENELRQLHELGFVDDRANVEAFGHLEAANLGCDSDDPVTVEQAIDFLLNEKFQTCP